MEHPLAATGGTDETLTQMWRSLVGRLGVVHYAFLSARIAVLTRRSISTGQYSVGFLTVAAGIVGAAVSASEASKEFYSAAAGAITTLLLALALTAAWFQLDEFPGPRRWLRERAQGRTLRQLLDEWKDLEKGALATALYVVAEAYYGEWAEAASRWVFRAFYGLCVLAALLVGEVFALLALMDAHPEKAGEPRPIFGAITPGLVGVGVVALFGGREKRAA
jgi:hypothetical protein